MDAIAVQKGHGIIRQILKRFSVRPVPDSGSGGVAITFDDAFVGEWHSIKGLLKAYAAKATFFVSHFDQLTDDSIEKLRVLQNEGHEIGYHGLRHLNAVNFVKETSLDNYLVTEIIPGMNIMAEHGFVPTSFSYPYGAHTREIDEALLKCFKHIRGTAFTDKHKRMVNLDHIYYKKRHAGMLYGAGVDNIYRIVSKIYKKALEGRWKRKRQL